MTVRAKGLLALVGGAVLVAGACVVFMRHGFSARDQPLAIEAFLARRVRELAIPRAARDARNPFPRTDEILAQGRAHFADHCASCHANDGSGDTEIGRNLYPPAPDMRAADTQTLSDGEIFYIIHNGIRFTGMPAWGPADPADDQGSWKLVHFIRHLPRLTAAELAEMKRLNPKSSHEIAEEEQVQRFLAGDDPAAHPPQHR